MTVTLDDQAWRRFADSLPVVAYSTAADGAIESVNGHWYEFSGVSSDASLAEEWPRVLHPDDAGWVAERWARSLENGEPFREEFRLRHAGGSYRWVANFADPVRDGDGAIVRWIGIVLDVDDRVRAREALAERERMFEAISEAIPQIMWTANASGWLDWYNHGWYDYTGQTPEEAAGWGWQAVHHPEDFPEVMRRWPLSIESGQPFEMEFRLRGRDGGFRWFLTRAHPLRDEQGTIVRWYGTNTDIDVQKRAQQRSERVAETLQNVFLPTSLPEPAGFRFDADYVASERDALVGGDWFDAFELTPERIVISIGDVAGHGLDASVSAGRLRQAIAVSVFETDDPAEVLEKVNRVLRLQEDTMATALVGFFDPREATLRYAVAGHPPPICASPVSPAHSRRHGGLPLGVDARVGARSDTLELPPDGVCVLYTDGLVEFGRDIERAQRALLRAADTLVREPGGARPAVALRRAVLGDAAPVDDIAILVLQRTDTPAQATQGQGRQLVKAWRFHSSDPLTARTSRLELMRFVHELAAPGSETFNAELILGEILANTVEHAPGMVEILIDWSGERPVVVARDTGPGLVSSGADLPSDQFDENGRGLFLIHALGENVDVRPSPGFGTELRVTLPVSRPLEALR